MLPGSGVELWARHVGIHLPTVLGALVTNISEPHRVTFIVWVGEATLQFLIIEK